MKLEVILKGIGRTLLTGVFCGIVSGCVPITNQIPDKVNIVIDTAQTGMIKGRTVIPQVEDNHVVWYGKTGANVEVEGTTFKTTSISGGAYAIDGIPTGSYNVKANFKSKWGIEYLSNPEPAIVTRQGVADISEIKLIPYGYPTKEILHGKAYINKEKTSPFVGILKLCEYGGMENELGRTTTSSDGSYAFQASMNRIILVTDSGKIRFFSEISTYGAGDIYVDGIEKVDCFLTNN
jgi:hypothetical protein